LYPNNQLTNSINSTLTDSNQRKIFQLFHPVPKGIKLKNQPFPLGIQGKKVDFSNVLK
jgi:hypothetical protein